MTDERWRQVEALFGELIDCPVAERQAILERRCGEDQELRQELESLLACDDPGRPLVEIPAAVALVSEEDNSGRRVGPYQLIRLLGHGGMGAVYLGVRVDDQYQKQVAVKLLKRGMDTEFMLRRFRQERQILANLEHPFIARLLDGGATDDGLPYFVMEYVDGVPITTYCRNHQLTIPERLRLFRMVCEAVQHAHQHLVVHRDLKPGNILTTKEGVPKLLDFGIAKMIDPEMRSSRTLTRPEFRMLTPDYASPEQVKGLPISTASDVYSLGAILYELLARQKPHRFASESLTDMEKAICEIDPERPSTVAARNAEVTINERRQSRRQLAGDLDTIVLTAMRKEPQRRYSSVAALSEDLRRHMEALPILAHADSWSYRSGRFIRRNRLTVAAAMLVVASLVGGIIATTIQAHRAERRFQMVRGLARSVLFDLYGEMERLPGSTALRATTVQTVVKYLDDLARDGPQDPTLDLEIATAYERVAHLEGHTFGPNLGQGQAALNDFRKALAIFERLAKQGQKRDQVIRGLIDTHVRVSGMEAMLGNPTAAEWHSQKAATIAAATLDSGSSAIPHRTKANLYLRLADVEYQRGSAGGELAFHSKALETSQAWMAAEQSPAAAAQLVDCYRNVGSAQARNGDLPAALRSYRSAREFASKLAQRTDSTPDHAYEVVNVITSIGDVLAAPDDPNLGDHAGAIRNYQEALQISERLAGIDPRDVNSRRILAGCSWRLGMMLGKDQPEQAIEHCQRALRISEELGVADPRNAEYRYHSSRALLWMGEALQTLRRYDESVTALRRALELQNAIRAVSPERIWNLRVLSRTYAALGGSLAGRGDFDAALAALREGLTVADRMLERAPSSLSHQLDRADVLEAMAKYYLTLSRAPGVPVARRTESKAEARSCYEKSLAIWRDWHSRKLGAPYPERRMAQALAALASLDRL